MSSVFKLQQVSGDKGFQTCIPLALHGLVQERHQRDYHDCDAVRDALKSAIIPRLPCSWRLNHIDAVPSPTSALQLHARAMCVTPFLLKVQKKKKKTTTTVHVPLTQAL
jgi:hypothetical protein